MSAVWASLSDAWPEWSKGAAPEIALWGGCIAGALAAVWYGRRIGLFGRSGAGRSSARGLGGGRRGGQGGGGKGPAAGGGFGRDVSGVPAPIWFVAAAMTLLSMTVGSSLAAGLNAGVRGAPGSLQFASVTAAGAFGLAALVALMFLYFLWPRFDAGAGMTWRFSDVWVGAWGMVLTTPFYLLTSGASAWVSAHVFDRPPPTTAHSGLRLLIDGLGTPWAWVFALVAVTLTPIAEEFVYRIYGQSAARSLLGEGVGRVWLAVIVIGAIFAATHALGGGPVPWAAVPGLFVLGVGMGVAYERTRRLGVPIVMHALFNAANLVLAVVSAEP